MHIELISIKLLFFFESAYINECHAPEVLKWPADTEQKKTTAYRHKANKNNRLVQKISTSTGSMKHENMKQILKTNVHSHKPSHQ